MGYLKQKKELKKKIRKETKQNKDLLVKKYLDLEEQELNAAGDQRESPGIKATKELAKEQTTDEVSLKWRDIDYLDSVKKNRPLYRERLTNVLWRLLSIEIEEGEVPKNYQVHAWNDKVGACVAFKNKNGQIFTRGFKASYLPVYDQQACFKLVYEMMVEIQRRWKKDIYDAGIAVVAKPKLILPDGYKPTQTSIN